MKNKKLRLKKGFTLLELLLVIAIIASLAGIILMALNPAQRLEEANETKYLANARDLKKAIEAYSIENGGNLPTGFSSLSYGYYNICKEGESTDCVNIDELVPEYLPSIPEDSNNSTSTTTGFAFKYDPSKTLVEVYSNEEYTARLESGTTFTEGLIGYTKFDESGGSSVADSSGNGIVGTLTNGPSLIAGKYGNAVNFDGVNDFVTYGNVLDFGGDNFSLVTWFKLNANAPDTNGLGFINKQVYNSNIALRVGFSIVLQDITNSKIAFIAADGSQAFKNNVHGWQVDMGQNLFDGNWHNLVYTLNKNDDSIAVYFDGVFISSTGWGLGSISNADQFEVGRGPWSFGGTYLTGIIDDMRVYNRALNSDEVTALYDYGAPPVAHWRFDEGSGTTVKDSSGNDNTGTLTNGPTWASGRYENALNYDGTNDYISVGNSEYLNLINSYSVTAWVKPSSFNRNILNKHGTTYTTDNGYIISLNSIGKIWFWNASGRDKFSNSSVTLNQWSHVAVTVTKNVGVTNNNTIKFYINGNLDNQATGVYETAANSVNLTIGQTWWGSVYFAGQMDDIRIYNYARTQEQILHDMNNN